jgi:hypothetical protein
MSSNRTFVPDTPQTRLWFMPAIHVLSFIIVLAVVFYSGYATRQMISEVNERSRRIELAQQAQRIEQRVALRTAVQTRLMREAAERHGGVLEHQPADLYYHTNPNGHITVHDGGPWGDDCRQLHRQEPRVVEHGTPAVSTSVWYPVTVTEGPAGIRLGNGHVSNIR